jgi:DNA-binding NarL/FixJ family response regulator
MGASEYIQQLAISEARISDTERRLPIDSISPAAKKNELFASSRDKSVSTHADLGNAEKLRTFAIIEKRPFMRECLSRSLSSCSTICIETFSSVAELLASPKTSEASLVILSVVRLSETEARQELVSLFKAMPHLPTIVLAHEEDMTGALEAIGYGAKGYIPASLGFDIAIEAMRFVNAGGTYIPAECLMAARQAPAPQPQSPTGAITNRELAVIQALRQGKPNKIIAYELNMCESTVKVHVRHLMKKLRAKNRTEVAMKAGEYIKAAACSTQPTYSIDEIRGSSASTMPCAAAAGPAD